MKQPTQDDLSKLVDREVHYCVSALIHTLAQHSYTERGDLLEVMEQAAELSAPIDDYEEAAFQENWRRIGDYHWINKDAGEESLDADTAQELCQDHNIAPYQREVFEHWIVSDWLADKLETHGEKVDRDFAGLTVWARTTTGQGIASDPVIETIWRELHD